MNVLRLLIWYIIKGVPESPSSARLGDEYTSINLVFGGLNFNRSKSVKELSATIKMSDCGLGKESCSTVTSPEWVFAKTDSLCGLINVKFQSDIREEKEWTLENKIIVPNQCY